MAGNPALLPVDSVCDLRLVLICTLYGSATIAFVACRLHRTEEGTGQTDDDLICDGFGLVGRCLFFGTRHPKRTGYRKEYSAEDARNRCPLRSDIKLQKSRRTIDFYCENPCFHQGATQTKQESR